MQESKKPYQWNADYMIHHGNKCKNANRPISFNDRMYENAHLFKHKESERSCRRKLLTESKLCINWREKKERFGVESSSQSIYISIFAFERKGYNPTGTKQT